MAYLVRYDTFPVEADVETRTGAETYLGKRHDDPEYAEAYARAKRRIDQIDGLVRTLDEQRERLGISKAELARRAELPAAAVRRLFSSRHHNPTMATVVALGDALDLDVTVTVRRRRATKTVHDA